MYWQRSRLQRFLDADEGFTRRPKQGTAGHNTSSNSIVFKAEGGGQGQVADQDEGLQGKEILCLSYSGELIPVFIPCIAEVSHSWQCCLTFV